MIYAAIALTVATAKLSGHNPWRVPVIQPPPGLSAEFLTAVGWAPPKLGTNSCVKTGQCYAGSDPAADCCDGHVIADPLQCTEELTCTACKMATKEIVSLLTKEACKLIIPSADITCEALGLGPEAPMADLCAVVA